MKIRAYRQCSMDLYLGVGLELFNKKSRELCPVLPIFSISFDLLLYTVVFDFGGKRED